MREHKLDEINLDDLAEALDSMGAKERRELMSRLDVLLTHLLKWEHQPDQRSTSWDGTIREPRRQIARELKQSPRLQPFLPEALADVYPDAVDLEVVGGHLHRGCDGRRLVLIWSMTPRSRMRWTSASKTSRGSGYLGMPKRIMPPEKGPASWVVTWRPRRAR